MRYTYPRRSICRLMSDYRTSFSRDKICTRLSFLFLHGGGTRFENNITKRPSTVDSDNAIVASRRPESPRPRNRCRRPRSPFTIRTASSRAPLVFIVRMRSVLPSKSLFRRQVSVVECQSFICYSRLTLFTLSWCAFERVVGLIVARV